MRHLLAIICSLSALTAACDGDHSRSIQISSTDHDDAKGVLKVIDALQCPQTMRSLTRKGTARAGGTVCSYAGPKGAEVSLHLVRLDDEPVDQVLRAFEARLSASMPGTTAALDEAETEARAEAARAEADALRAGVEANRGAGQTTVQGPGFQVDTRDDDASVRMPGLNIETNGDRASIRIGDISLNASDGAGNVNINTGGNSVSIQAHDSRALVRTSAGGDAVRTNWVLTDNQPAEQGWKLVAYEARGPRTGPIVVATVKSRDGDRGRVFEDARDLVTLNVGR